MITRRKKGEINMAAPKKKVEPAVEPAVKTETVAKAETVAKTEKAEAAPKAETAAPAEQPAAEAPKKEHKRPGRKPKAEKAADVKAEAAKKIAEKKATVRKTTKKADQKAMVHIQFSGKSYSQEELVKMAQDVWKYDLKQKVRELATIDLYVKPEENMVYYVMNQEFTGSFYI